MDRIAVLISARPNSKFLAKFLHRLMITTQRPDLVDIHVMLNAHDTWNMDIVAFYDKFFRTQDGPLITFHSENKHLGRAGLHEYFNEMVPDNANWYIYFCEDHYINAYNWDEEIRQFINKKKLDSSKVACIVPKFDNAGAMNHILSAGYITALEGVLGRHGWIDSYINDLNVTIPEHVYRMDDDIFHDFTHDKPNPMSEEHLQPTTTHRAQNLPLYKSEKYYSMVEDDRLKLAKAIAKEDLRNEL